MNKRGTDKILSVYWFAILFLVAAGIVYMVAVFYGQPYDVRDVEINILINKIANCFAEGGRLKYLLDEINNDNFLSKCGLTFNVEDTNNWENDQFYVNVSFYDFDNSNGIGGIGRNSIVYDNANLEDSCGTGKYAPVCLERSFYVLDKNSNNQYVIKILSIVRKTEKNVK